MQRVQKTPEHILDSAFGLYGLFPCLSHAVSQFAVIEEQFQFFRQGVNIAFRDHETVNSLFQIHDLRAVDHILRYKRQGTSKRVNDPQSDASRQTKDVARRDQFNGERPVHFPDPDNISPRHTVQNPVRIRTNQNQSHILPVTLTTIEFSGTSRIY